jgi:cation diffusion facilitator CzcD-associated flavoprotein CzcO
MTESTDVVVIGGGCAGAEEGVGALRHLTDAVTS